MQEKLIKSQQAALKAMGLYNGAIDGIWDGKSRSAMAGLRHRAEFGGCAVPIGNTFFRPFCQLPKGWTWAKDGSEVIFDTAGAEAERQRVEAERKEQERLEAERLENERLENERLENERLEQERLAAQQPAAPAQTEPAAPEQTAADAPELSEDEQLAQMIAEDEAKNAAPQSPAEEVEEEIH